MKKTLLLVFIHGFKGSDDSSLGGGTFNDFPKDLRALIRTTLPKLEVLSVQYPRYETRGDLRECVAKFKEWLMNKTIDLEVANGTPSPTVDPSVHIVLVGHSMGGIVAAETLLSIIRDEPVPFAAGNNLNATETQSRPQSPGPNLAQSEEKTSRPSSATPEDKHSVLFFPYIEGVLAFDTPYLGISPGVLAHGAEEHINHASTAYKAYNSAQELFGWGNKSTTPQPIANASSRGLPAADGSTKSGWGKWAMYGGAAAAIAGAAGAAYMSRNQITQGFSWASSHLEFVGCLARGAELQKRVESVVKLADTHSVGFADFYTALGDKSPAKTEYAGYVLGQDRTFCVVPKAIPDSSAGSKRSAPSGEKAAPAKRWRTKSEEDLGKEMEEGEKVQQFAKDTSKSKGDWVKCVNEMATDELKAHTSMFTASKNPGYFAMLPLARDKVVDWVDEHWYEEADGPSGDEERLPAEGLDLDDDADCDGGAEAEMTT
jgi:hypothetical protein